jgi:branched-chain amino acid aminotransferase
MIDAKDRGFLLGDGVFETLLVVNRCALWLDAHLARMKKAARKLDLPFELEMIANAVATILAQSDSGMHILRVTLTRGVTMRGLAVDAEKPTLDVSLEPFDARVLGRPIKLATSSIRRNPASVTDRHKTISYANNVFAAREAKARRADDALILNQDGLVACTAMANIFMIKDSKLVTPPEQDGVLPGIIRRYLIEKTSVEVRSVEKDELLEADGCFATNSLRFISPITRIDADELPPAQTDAYMNLLLSEAQVQCGVSIMEFAS